MDGGNDELGELAAALRAHARCQLEKLDRARREFIANASHELRTPLFSLGGFLELMTDEELDEATRQEFLVTMREQVDRLAKLATDLLDLSRMDAGRMHVEARQSSWATRGAGAVREFRALAEQRRHALRAEVDGEPVARGDEQRVLQIGRALVENALVHTPPGTKVLVRARPRGPGARSRSRDDGPGIAGEDARHVFDRFYRVEGAWPPAAASDWRSRANSRPLMGGDVTLESAPGRTVVTLMLASERVPEREPAPAPVFT